MAAALLVLCLIVVATAIGTILLPRKGSPEPEQHVTGPDKYDQDASSRVVGLIDLLFALVLTLPVVASPDVFRSPWHSNVSVVLATILGYYVVIRSFIDWHIAMEDAPYWIRTSAKRSWELWRLYVDCAIVIVYVMLFLSAESLAEHPRGDISEYLFLFAVIFALYITWGQLRRVSYQKQHEFRWQTLALAGVGFVAIWAAYALDRDHVHWLSAHPEIINIAGIALAFALYASYRHRNWREMRKRRAVTVPANEGAAI